MKLLATLLSTVAITANAGELVKFESIDTRLNKSSTVLAEVFIPPNFQGKLPVIITQHGSSQKESFDNGPGYTDIFSKEVVKQGLASGFAVVTIDAFYGKGLTPTSKIKFPNSSDWAYELRDILNKDPRFDADKTFYTGFSYGGEMVIKSFTSKHTGQRPWKAVAPAEPGCGVQPSARKLPYPVLFIKTADSHYPPAPCIYLSDQLNKAGAQSEVVIIPGANHHFSSNGTTIRQGGIALNGCTDNPVIRTSRGPIHADGTPLTKSNPFEECVTNTSGGGGNPDKLSLAVNYIITFFNKQK